MKTVAIIEARMGSSRLPGKSLMDIAGKTLIERVVERIRLSKSVDEVVIATTVNAKDDRIIELCESKLIKYFRGSEEDVLNRVYRTALEYKADIIVQSGADCPLYDPELIDLLVYLMKWGGYSYCANDMKLTFPEGIDAHVIAFDALKSSAEEAKTIPEREDTPRFIWNHPDRFPIFNLEAVHGSVLNRPDIRLTVDYKEDMILIRKVYETFSKSDKPFTSFDVVKLLGDHPEWLNINKNCEQRSAAYIDLKDS